MTVEKIQLTEMDDHAIRTFLATQKMGVLGLPTDDVPYLLRLIERTDRAGFLSYATDSPFNWESVVLSGTVDAWTGYKHTGPARLRWRHRDRLRRVDNPSSVAGSL